MTKRKYEILRKYEMGTDYGSQKREDYLDGFMLSHFFDKSLLVNPRNGHLIGNQQLPFIVMPKVF